MKRVFSVLTCMLLVMLVSRVAAEPLKYSLTEALGKNLITVKAHSKGGATGYSVTMNVKNNGTQPILVTIEPGTRLSCADTGQQDVIIVYTEDIYLDPSADKDVDVAAYCCEQSKSSPLKGVSFSVQGMAQPEVVKFAQYVDAHRFKKIEIQQTLWKIIRQHPGELPFETVPVEAPPAEVETT